MATRKSEWLASIKPILDRDEAKKDAAALARELGDILEVKVDASPENLSELGKEFNEQLKAMGKQPIVFSEKTLSGIVSQFANAIAAGLSQGIVNGAQEGIKESLQQLKLQQADLKRERARVQAELNKKVTNKKDFNDLLDFDGESVHSLEIDGDALEEAKKQYNEFLKIGRELNKIQKEQGVDSKEYVKALYDAENALHGLYKMRKTLQKLETPIPTGLKAAYGLLDPYTEQPKYEQKMEDAGKKPMLPFYETKVGNFVGDSWERYVVSVRQSQEQLIEIDNQMASIDAQIVDITKSIQTASDAVNVVVDNANNGLKTLNEIEEKYRELTDKLEFQNKQRLNAAINYKPHINKDGEIADGIKTFANDYTEAVASGDWTKEYAALLKYVKLYESYLEMGTKAQRNKITSKSNPFTPLYNQLKPMAENAENMLKSVVNMMDGKPPVGLDGAKKEKPQDTSTDAANTERISEVTKDTANEEARAREEAEKKALADKESEEATRRAREEAEAQAKADAEAKAKAEAEAKAKVEAAKQRQLEEENAAKIAEQQKVNNEASVDLAKEELDLTKQRVQILEQFDQEHRKQTKPGQRIETAAQLDSKTGAIDRFTVGDADGVKLPGSLVEDTEWGKQKSHLDTGLHTHWTDTAAPSPKDLEIFEERLNYQRLEIIRAMQEALFLDFSKISDKALKQLINDYAKIAKNIKQQFDDMSMADRIKSFGGDGNYDEQLQKRLKEEFVRLVKDIPGFAEYVQKPMWSEFSDEKQIDKDTKIKAEPKVVLADEYERANEEVKELIKNYAILTRNMSHNIGDANSFDQLDKIEEKLKVVAPELLNVSSIQWKDFGEKFMNEADSVEVEANAHKKNTEAIKEEVAVQEKLDQVKKGQAYSGTLYHGSQTPMDDITYDVSKGKGLKNLGSGLYFTPDLEQAAKHGKNILQQDVQLDNVFTLTEEFITDIDALYKAMGKIKPADVDWKTIKSDLLNTMKLPGKAQEFAKNMREMGYQGMYSKGYGYGDPNVEQLVIYDEKYQKHLSTKPYSDVVRNITAETDAHNKNANAITTETLAQEQLNDAKVQGDINVGASTGDASSADVDTANAEAEKLRLEKEQLEAEKLALQKENDAKLKAANDEKLTLQNDLDIANEQIKIAQDSEAAARARADEADLKLIEKDKYIQDLEERLTNVKTGVEESKTAINTEELKSVLETIVSNVKFAQNDSEQKHAPWALESTLNTTIKGVLDSIQTNTSRIGTVETSNVDAIAGAAHDSKLTEIKSVLDSIDGKIAKGGAITKKGDNQPKKTEPDKDGNRQTGRSTEIKSLIGDYERLGKLRAQFEKDGNLETKARLKNLAAEVESKRESLNLTSDEILELRKKSDLAYKAEQRLIDAAKAQKEIDDQRRAETQNAKQQTKDAETAWKKQVKDAQRATGINAATSTANAGDQTVLRAIGTEGVSKDIEGKAKELAERIKALRVLRDEIDKKGEQATNEDRDNLSKQIAKVKELKTEVDGYLKIHEKYSGEGATQFNDVDTSNFGAVGTDQYWNNITAAIKNASSGRVAIKGMNTDTGELTGTTKIAANTFAEWSATVDPITGKLSILRTGIKRTETIIESITRKTKEIFTYFSGSSIIFKAFNELKNGVRYVRDIDLALTELKKVTDETEETYRKFLDTAAKTADKVGSTIQKVVSSTADWARLGYSMKEAAEFAESTQILMNVSEFTDVSQATDTLISAVQAFGYTAETSMDVVDLLNTIGNNYAISTSDLAQSLTKSSASLVAAGGNLAEAAALTATANAIIQDADSVGTALKTTSLRLRGTSVKVLEEEGLDSDGAIESTSKLRSQVLATSGVDILTDSGAYKSTYQILLEIAEVWDKITDDKARAGLLELLAGKRNSSVIAALLQNPEQLKAAYEDAQNAEGSALKENEKYLDSIQGKIDQFNNAVQTLWNNTLNSDWVKLIIEAGTWLVKILDTLKPISVLIAGIAVYLNKKYNFVDFSNLLTGFKEAFSNFKGPKDFFKNLIGGFKNTEISIEKAKAKLAELEDQKAKLGDPKSEKNRQKIDVLDQEINKYKEMLAPSEDLVAAQNKLKAAQDRLANTKSTNPKTLKQYQREVDKAKANVDNLTAAQKKSAQTGKTAFSGLGKSVKAFGKQVASVITQMLVMWAITKVIELLAKGFDALITTAEEAAEKYEELNSELDALKNNIEDINDELSTLDDRIAELTAKGALSFTEKEELERLRAEREELERTLELNQQLANQKQQQVNNQTSDQVEYYRNKGVKSGKTTKEHATTGAVVGGAIGVGATAAFGAKLGTAIGTAIAPGVGSAVGAVLGVVVGGIVGVVAGAGIGAGIGASEEKIGESIENMEEKLAEKEKAVEEARAKYQESGSDKDREKYEKAQKALSDYRGEMAQYFTELDAMYQNVDLSTIEDPDEYKRLKEEMNDFYNERDKWLITSGAEGAESNAIERIFSKDDYESASDTIDSLLEKLKKDPTDQSVLNQISEQCKAAEADLLAVGLSVQDAIDYFTMLGQNAAFDTIEGKTADITLATSKLQTLLSDTKSIDFTGLFGHGGEVSATAIAEYFQGTSEATRKEIARLVKNIHDGEITVEQALKSFAAYGMVESWKIIETEVSELNTNVFKDLGEDISGIINTVKELSSAFESVASSIELVDKAQAEMAYSGHLSVETALQLMESTDDWNKVLKIEEGNIKLVDGAEEALVQTKLDLIKKNLQTALSTVEAQLAQISATEASADMAYTIEESTNLAVTQLAGNMAYLTEMMTAYTRAAAGEKVDMSSVTAAAEAAKKQVLAATDYQKNAAEVIGREELEKEKARLEAMLGMYETVDTPSEFKSNYPSDEVSGGNADKDSAEDDLFQREMDYWENRIAANQAKYEQLQNEIDLLEKKGQKADASFYEEQVKLENQRLSLLDQQKAVALARLKEIEAAGGEGNEQWWEVANTLNDIEGELDGVTASILDLQDAIAEIDTYKFEEFNTRLDNLTSKLETIRNLIAPDGEEDWFDDEGAWTEAGVAVLGSQLQQLEMYKQGYQETMDELAEYEPDYESNKAYYEALGIHSEQEWYEKTEELISQQYDFAESISDTEQSVVDMYESSIDAVEEYTGKLIDSYNDYIDSVKEALDAERDLYDFKKNVQKQSKDIAAIERRIASLSGSTNKSDIAERRKLEAQLYESRESLNDTYYDHAKNAQSEALDKEAEAYETSMNNMIEGLRTSLEEATLNMDEFLMGVTSMVMYNADTVLAKYEETNLPLTKELTNPWEEAKKATNSYSGNALDLMNQWTKEGGFFAQFNATGTTNLQSPWSAGTTAANSFKTSVSTVMSGVVSNIATNVRTASGELSKLYQQIQDTEARASSANVVISGSGGGGSGGYVAPQKKYYVTAFLDMGSRSLSVTKSDSKASAAMSAAKIAIAGEYEKVKGNSASAENAWLRTWRDRVKYTTQYYAKGTTGTTRDEWAITDEPRFGDELVLVPGKDGNLSFVRKGTGIVPADMTQKLFELAQIPTSDLMNKNLTAIVPNITKNDFKNEFNFESLVHVDKVDSDTLPKLEKMVDKKIDDFSKALNYSLKRFAR